MNPAPHHFASAHAAHPMQGGIAGTGKAGDDGKAPVHTAGTRFRFNPARAGRACSLLRRRFSEAMNVLSLLLVCVSLTASAQTLELAPEVEVDSAGVLVGSLFPALASEPVGGLKLADAPEFGRSLSLSREALAGLLAKHAPDVAVADWTGAASVKIGRRSRMLSVDEIQEWLVATLQQEQVRDRGELEIRIGRAWKPAPVPDEALTFRLVDMPLSGISPSFIARIAVECDGVRVATLPVALQAKIWKDVLVAGGTLVKGQPLGGAEVRAERRDVLVTRDYVTPEQAEGGSYEFVSTVSMGQVVTGRALRIRPAITRGTVVDALVTDGAMTISMKVEVLEDAVVGQNLRVRNLKTRREMLGKVQNEQTVVLYL